MIAVRWPGLSRAGVCVFAVGLGVGILPVAPAVGQAQQPELAVRGRLIGPDTVPLAELRVILHRVDSAGGNTVAAGVSEPDGTFALTAPAATDTAGLYFVAVRYLGELYIGNPFRADEAAGRDHVLQVGIPGTSATALLGSGRVMDAGGRPATPRSWALFMLPLAGFIAVAAYLLIGGRRVPRHRRLLIRLAHIDEAAARAGRPPPSALAEERARLVERLRAL